MVKINDTTTFPITVPSKGDLVIGTDISDTGNDPNGETVNISIEGLHNVTGTSAAWHWYDSENYGDSGTGAIFDFDVDGSGISSVDTPNFEDGYEYSLILDELGSTSSTNINLEVDYENSPSSRIRIIDGLITNNAASARYKFTSPRFSRVDHSFKLVYGPEESNFPVLSTKDKVVKLTLSLSSTNATFSGGKILLARRRDMLT